MEPIPITRGKKCRNSLIRMVRIATRIRLAFLEYIGGYAYRLVVHKPVEQCAAPSDCRFYHDHAAARSQHTLRFVEKSRGIFQMMQHVDHDDITSDAGRERKTVGVDNGIEPRSELNVGRDYVTQPFFEVADAATDLDCCSWHTRCGDAIIEVVINNA